MQLVEFGDIKIVFRRATVGDDVAAQSIAKSIMDCLPDKSWGVWDQFGLLCATAVKAKGLPFDPLAMYYADKDQRFVAYNEYLRMDKDVKDAFVLAMNAENAPRAEIIVRPLADDTDLNW